VILRKRSDCTRARWPNWKAGVRALSQAIIVYILALLLGVGISLNPLNIVGVAAAIVIGSGAIPDPLICVNAACRPLCEPKINSDQRIQGALHRE
jgi:hypothetical protein